MISKESGEEKSFQEANFKQYMRSSILNGKIDNMINSMLIGLRLETKEIKRLVTKTAGNGLLKVGVGSEDNVFNMKGLLNYQKSGGEKGLILWLSVNFFLLIYHR